MKPYYQEDGITIFCCDCRDVLPMIYADVLVTDPPYGVNLKTKTSDYRQSERFDNGESLRASVLYLDTPDYVRGLIQLVIPIALERVTRGLIFTGPNMMFYYPEPAAIGGVYTPNGAGRCSWGFQCIHPILYYGKDPFLADGKGSRPNSFKTEQPNREVIDHPCPKPIGWMRWAVTRSSREGETILDPFMGSGTTLRAAKDLGRNAIGIEISREYCDIAIQRLQQQTLPLNAEHIMTQTTMFDSVTGHTDGTTHGRVPE